VIRFSHCLFAAAVAALCAGSAQAQMFGTRQLGGMLSRQPSPGGTGNAASPAIGNPGGTITGAERFVRGARQANDFVGTDTGDRRGYVGRAQSRIRRATPVTTNLQTRPEPKVNQAAPSETSSATSLYQPRLALAPELSGTPPGAIETALVEHLRRSGGIRWTGPLKVSLEGRTAVLRGEVASARDRELAEALAQFEPGIDDVQNDLRVQPPAISTPVIPAGPESRGQAPESPPSGPAGQRSPREF
jgi:hypothetical protein